MSNWCAEIVLLGEIGSMASSVGIEKSSGINIHKSFIAVLAILR